MVRIGTRMEQPVGEDGCGAQKATDAKEVASTRDGVQNFKRRATAETKENKEKNVKVTFAQQRVLLDKDHIEEDKEIADEDLKKIVLDPNGKRRRLTTLLCRKRLPCRWMVPGRKVKKSARMQPQAKAKPEKSRQARARCRVDDSEPMSKPRVAQSKDRVELCANDSKGTRRHVFTIHRHRWKGKDDILKVAYTIAREIDRGGGGMTKGQALARRDELNVP